MYKIWVDDIRPMPKGYDFHCRTSKDAIKAIRIYSNRITEISLDHDLGNNDDGYLVANYIELMAYTDGLHPIKWHIHSANPVGRKRMEDALKNADKYWREHGYL